MTPIKQEYKSLSKAEQIYNRNCVCSFYSEIA